MKKADNQSERALALMEHAFDKLDKYDARSVVESMTKFVEAHEGRKPRFHERAWFIHGFWVGVVTMILVIAKSTQGTLIYDLVVPK